MLTAINMFIWLRLILAWAIMWELNEVWEGPKMHLLMPKNINCSTIIFTLEVIVKINVTD